MSNITKLALEESLKQLMLKKPFNKITIADITEHCGVNRMTFYYHFKDIYDLVEWACVEDAKKALAEKKTYDTWQMGFYQIFEALLVNKPFIMNVYRTVKSDRIEEYLYEVTFKLLIDVVEEEAAGMEVSDSDKTFIANFLKYGFVGLVLEWIKDDMKEDPKVIIDRLSTMLQGSISEALERYTKLV